MSNNRVNTGYGPVVDSPINAFLNVKDTVMAGGRCISTIGNDLHTVPGLTGIVKLAIASMELLQKLNLTTVDVTSYKTAKALKDLYYATAFIENIGTNFVVSAPNKSTGETTYSFAIPKYKKAYDWAKILNLVGDISETCLVLYKNNVCKFKLICDLSTKYGYMPLFSIGGKAYRIEDLFYFWLLNHKLKDLLMVPSCLIELNRFNSLNPSEKERFVNYAKAACSVGKIFLILGGPSLGASKGPINSLAGAKGILFAIANVAVQFLSVARTEEKAQTERKKVGFDAF